MIGLILYSQALMVTNTFKTWPFEIPKKVILSVQNENSENSEKRKRKFLDNVESISDMSGCYFRRRLCFSRKLARSLCIHRLLLWCCITHIFVHHSSRRSMRCGGRLMTRILESNLQR